jgi:tRNA A-37 threonylcarbamoyl transferase component Bud32
MTKLENHTVIEEKCLELCREITDSSRIFAACFYGSRIYGSADSRAEVNALLIIPNYQAKIESLAKHTNGLSFSILAVDKEVFENDVEYGKLGEYVTEIIALPYQPWINRDYLRAMEVKIKKRFVLELLENIIFRYPELSMELIIKPEYFMHEVIRRKSKLFPPSKHMFSEIFEKKVRKRNLASIMEGYFHALKELEKENIVDFSDEYVKINNDHIIATKRERTQFSAILASIQKAILPYIQSISSKMATIFTQNNRLFKNHFRQKNNGEWLQQINKTEEYLLMPTPLGLVPLSDETSIEEFIRKKMPGGEALEMAIEEIGGVLNSVFLIRFQRNNTSRRIVAKKFEDWLGFKWFPLALWTLGTQSFAVLGITRLEREYSINQFLNQNGFAVPRVLYISFKERLLIEDFVEGEKVSQIIKRAIIALSKGAKANNIDMIKTVGQEIAKAHLLGVALGDCKPENILVTEDGKICFLDLEQATRNGNQPWDIAEFLYYSGHYILPIHSDEAARQIASSFLDGYLEAGGKKETVRKAASAKYTKVFSIFTLPHIILTIADTCKTKGR